jgi:hypothetical protein
MTVPVLEKRYQFHCVAPEVYGGPSPTDDLDEALLSVSDYYGSHWDIYDVVERKYVPGPCSLEEIEEIKERWAKART